MSVIRTFMRDYFVFMLILFLFSYLAPREEYRKYFQFFIGALMAVILFRPVFAFVLEDGEQRLKETLDGTLGELERMELYGEGEDIYEWFLRHEGFGKKVDEGKK